MPGEGDDNVIDIPDNDKDGTQKIYDAMANAINTLPDDVRKHSRFAFWAIIAAINVLCRLVVVNSNMTKEQLLKQVGDIFTSYKNDGEDDKLLN